MSRAQHPWLHWLGLSAIVILLDQLSKYYFAFSSQALHFGERVRVTAFLDWTLLYNKGAAFSFLAQEEGWQRWFFTILGLAAAALIIFLLRKHRGQTLLSLSMALILGGAIGNVIDRLLHGHVVDFILFHYQEKWFYPAFNVADMAITLGAILLVLDELRRLKQKGRS